MSRYQAFWARRPWWGRWLFYSVAFAVFVYFVGTDRSVPLAIFAGIVFGTLNTLWIYWRRGQQDDA